MAASSDSATLSVPLRRRRLDRLVSVPDSAPAMMTGCAFANYESNLTVHSQHKLQTAHGSMKVQVRWS